MDEVQTPLKLDRNYNLKSPRIALRMRLDSVKFKVKHYKHTLNSVLLAIKLKTMSDVNIIVIVYIDDAAIIYK